jgi:hypothetical protein
MTPADRIFSGERFPYPEATTDMALKRRPILGIAGNDGQVNLPEDTR